MVSAFLKFIAEKDLCKPKHRILVAVSGGIDSAVMLDLFAKAGFDFSIAHCNFKLRAKESDQDELFVRELAKSYGVEYFAKSFDTETYAKTHKLSIQEAARELRYQWFDELVTKNNFDRIAIGQHLDDQIETFFINLFRGSGISGLKSIPVKRGRVIRPLLFATRKILEKYAIANALQFREDSSNKSDKYLRNKIRHKLLPTLFEINPTYQDDMSRSLSYLTEDNEIMQGFLSEWRKDFIENAGKTLNIKIELFKGLSNIQAFYLLKPYDYSREITDQLKESIHSGISGKLFSSQSHEILIDRDFLLLKEKEEQDLSELYLIEKNQTGIKEPVNLDLKIATAAQEFKFEKDPSKAYFDLDKLHFPLTLRKWQTGDRFVPFGMKGSKLVSDYLIDEKLSLFEKKNVWVLLSDEKIIWLVGYRASEKVKVDSETKSILEIQLKK